MKQWQILHSQPASASQNMEEDDRLLRGLSSSSPPLLHFYAWERPSITYGYFIEAEKHLQLELLDDLGFQAARRPTGGGIVLHTHDVAFSCLVPTSHPLFSETAIDNYATINRLVVAALEKFFGKKIPFELLPSTVETGVSEFCFAKPTRYDVMHEGKKVGGAAQRKTKQGFLHQGSLLLALPSKTFLSQIFKDPDLVIPLMWEQSYPLLGREVTRETLEKGKGELKACLCQTFQDLVPTHSENRVQK